MIVVSLRYPYRTEGAKFIQMDESAWLFPSEHGAQVRSFVSSLPGGFMLLSKTLGSKGSVSLGTALSTNGKQDMNASSKTSDLSKDQKELLSMGVEQFTLVQTPLNSGPTVGRRAYDLAKKLLQERYGSLAVASSHIQNATATPGISPPTLANLYLELALHSDSMKSNGKPKTLANSIGNDGHSMSSLTTPAL